MPTVAEPLQMCWKGTKIYESMQRSCSAPLNAAATAQVNGGADVVCCTTSSTLGRNVINNAHKSPGLLRKARFDRRVQQ
jgi:hypothetical protein